MANFRDFIHNEQPGDDDDLKRLFNEYLEFLNSDGKGDDASSQPINEEAPKIVRGPKGDKGDKGDPGERGLRGLRGITGPRGERGDRGEKGIKGDKGDKGDRGEKGEKGEIGSRGEKGDRGETGSQGAPGSQGLRGEKGAAGDRGPQGERGEKGEKGDQGERGEVGPQGIAGPKGDRGEDGLQGSQGIAGPAGERGEKGDVGPAGERGEKGDVGPAGERGEKGEKGDTGERGEKGDRGETGDSGIVKAIYPLRYDNKSKVISIDSSKLGTTVIGNPGGGLDTAFKTISVSGQSGLTAVQYEAENLNIVAGAGIAVSTDPNTNSLTISNLGGIGSTGPTGPRGPTGAGGALGYWGSFWDTSASQTGDAFVAYPVRFNNSDPSNVGVSLSGNTQIIIPETAIYNLQFSAQVFNAENNKVHDITFWLKKNGANIPDTAGMVSVDGLHTGITGAALPSWNWMMPFNANDAVELYWHSNDPNVFLGTLPAMASPSHPQSPAVIFTVQQVMYTQVGPTGPTGIGTTGATGDRGATGSTGAQGTTGYGYTAAGVSGDNYLYISILYPDGSVGSPMQLGYVKGATGATGAGASISDYVVTFNGLTGNVTGLTQAAGTTFGAVQYRDFADGATGLSASSQFVWGSEGLWINNKITVTGAGSFIRFADGTTQSTAYPPSVIQNLLAEIQSLSSQNYYLSRGDFDQNGVVNGSDLAVVLANWGTVPSPTAGNNYSSGQVIDDSLFPPTDSLNEVKSLVVYNRGSRSYNRISSDDLLSPTVRSLNGLTGNVTISGYKFSQGATAPTGASSGDRWFNVNNAVLYTFLIEQGKTAGQWINFSA